PEDRDLTPVLFRGLVMPRLKQSRPNRDKEGDDDRSSDPPDQCPPIEKDLEKLAETLEKLRPRSSRFGNPDDRFDPFGGDVVPPVDGKRKGKGKGDAAKPKKKQKELPEYCLVRVVDVTVRPGQTYEYRIKIKMANPNYLRKGAASADVKTLESASWSSQKLLLRVDPELLYYAVNQEEAGREWFPPGKYTDRHSKDSGLRPDRMTFFQAHRWVESIRLPPVRGEVPMGGWGVAERFPVFRGEYVGRTERVELPRWTPRLEDFVLATDPPPAADPWGQWRPRDTTAKKAKNKEPGVLVDFGHGRQDGKEAILVDFDSGPVAHDKTHGGGKDRPVVRRIADESAGEALLL